MCNVQNLTNKKELFWMWLFFHNFIKKFTLAYQLKERNCTHTANCKCYTSSVFIPFGLCNELFCNIMICITVGMILCLGRRNLLFFALEIHQPPKSDVVRVDIQTTLKQLNKNRLTNLLKHTGPPKYTRLLC
jgi:hypothetical protein